MKGIKLLLAVLLAPLAFHAAVADDASDIARAATRRNSASNITTTRQKNTQPQPKASTPSRTTHIDKSGTVVRERANTAPVSPRDGTVGTRTATSAEKSVSARSTTKIQPRSNKSTTRAAQPRAPSQSRSAITPTISKTRSATKSRTGAPSATARNATTTPDSGVLSRNFSKCRTVFYDCMDEFCATKDSQLKRCACSSRIHEFDSTKKNLANVEEKLLDFSQRLLTVNMDKEDAAALNTPTEGELAYSAKDTSDSKKMLDEIAKKLNSSFNNNNFDQDLNAISLSLNMDSAFDTLDSMAGASTTAKSGTDLYTSALPICREMALEICSAEDVAIAESSYQMAIESDCNTVKKSYQTQVDQAREQVFESGALLDMSRLDIHQKRNSDDILTCKRKMLEMLTDSTVCGTDMGKCLDTSGRYIDPTTGAAFLTPELTNLSSLISRPDSGQTWRTAPGNDRFVTFLNSKKKFLEPAMENCQDISDYVWDSFIDDALSQIKLAQEAKLEEMRQSCTTLTAQCLDETYDSITEFDARALSIFGVSADQTVNAMCADVQNACTALMNTSGGAENWQSGITEIATNKTYETILQTCREVGRACIIQACTSISGNFGLCENIDTSINRKSIINRSACWNEVVNCVASAGIDSLTQIQALHALDTIRDPNENPNAGIATTDTTTSNAPATGKPRPNIFRTFYGEMYGISDWNSITLEPGKETTNKCISSEPDNNVNCVHDICYDECLADQGQEQQTDTVSAKCYTCRLAERIWGNCEAPSHTELTNTSADDKAVAYHNQIKTTDSAGQSVDTLLAWFAKNTGTAQESDSCRDTSCRPGYTFSKKGLCVPPGNLDSSGETCPSDNKFYVYSKYTNCCNTGEYDSDGNCCASGKPATISPKDDTIYFGNWDNENANNKICTNNNNPNLVLSYKLNGIDYALVCMGIIEWKLSDGAKTDNSNYPNSTTVKCDGTLVSIDLTNKHYRPVSPVSEYLSEYYNTENGTCIYEDGTWKACSGDTTECTSVDDMNWSVLYDNPCKGNI